MKRNKYGAKKVKTADGTFDSQAEHRRWCELNLLQKAGYIKGLVRQQSFSIEVGGKVICRYVADFMYYEGGKVIVEDVKGVKTPAYQIKKKLMKAVFGIDIRETGKTSRATTQAGKVAA